METMDNDFDWQGRSEEKVKNEHKITKILAITFIFLAFSLILYKICTFFF